MDKIKRTISNGFTLAKLNEIPAECVLPKLDGLEFIPSQAPQSIHYDLAAAGKLANIYASRQNAVDAAWVSQSDWVYKTAFDLSEEEISADSVELELEGVDTFSDVFVNGQLIGTTDSALIPWTFLIPESLRAKHNALIVHVKGHGRMVAGKADENVRRIGCKDNDAWSRERTLVRRYQRSYNTDFLGGDAAVQGIGLLRPVNVTAYDLPSIKRTVFAVLDANGQKASVKLTVEVNGADEDTTIEAVVSLDGVTKLTLSGKVSDGKASFRTELPNPVFWWPNGSGAQTLYDLSVTLKKSGVVKDTYARKVGIRKSELILRKPNGRQDFQFVINNKPIYVRGANWVPLDMLNAGGTREDSEALLRLCVNANMNMLRLWGGGMEEPEWFYDLCDELGIMIWQDARMHSHTYPDYDDDFVRRVADESAQMVTRLRSHPCFVLFCGGNEQEEGWDTWNWTVWFDRFYGEKIIYEALPVVAAEYCPEIPYIQNSPYSEKNCQTPVDGDTHTWGNFINATEDPLFVTETCWYDGTISRPETLWEVCGYNPDDFTGMRWNAAYDKLTGHNLHARNEYSEYHDVSSLREYTRTCEIEQMRADYNALYYLRTRSPSCRGILYWPLNKGGTMMNYGCVDYRGRPLMPYYNLVRLFKDVTLHAYRDANDIVIAAANDGAERTLKLIAEHRTVDGRIINRYEEVVTLAALKQTRLATLANWYEGVTNRWREFVYAALVDDADSVITEDADSVITEDAVYFCPLRELEMEDARISASISKAGGSRWKITLKAEAFSKLVMLEADGKVMYSDNYFLLMPGNEKTVYVTTLNGNAPSKVTVQAIDRDEITTIHINRYEG